MSNGRSVGRPPGYYLVHDGGAGDGMVKCGPFEHATTAVKEKNRMEREGHFAAKYRVIQIDNEEDFDRAKKQRVAEFLRAAYNTPQATRERIIEMSETQVVRKDE